MVDGWTAYRLGVGPNPAGASPAKASVAYAKAGDTSAHVKVVQVKLGVKPASGFFGDRTRPR